MRRLTITASEVFRSALLFARFHLWAFLLLVLVLGSWCVAGAADPSAPPQSVTKIYFVPLGRFSPSAVERLVGYYRSKYGMEILTLPAIPFDRAAVNYHREQLIGDQVVNVMKRLYPDLANDPTVLLIGLTADDLYIRSFSWRYAFAYRTEGRFVVVSTYRMDNVNHGLSSNPSLLEFRLTKMVTKQLGICFFLLNLSSDKNSVMYSPVMSLDDLDDMGEDFKEVNIPFMK